MKNFWKALLLVLISFLLLQCKNEKSATTFIFDKNEIQYAKGFTINNYKGYAIVTVKNPWPKSTKNYTYILKKKNGIVPDSLKQNLIISVPIKTIVVTSTTHIPSLEMLNELNSLVGFPHCNYIS